MAPARDPERWPGVPRLPWAAVPAGAALAVATVGLGLWLKGAGPAGPDPALGAVVRRSGSPDLDLAALVVRYGLSVPVAAAWLLLAGLVLWAGDRHPRRALAFVSLALPGWLATAVVKPIVQRPRPRGADPWGQLGEVGPHSFPSAHTAIGTGVACAVVLVLCWSRGPAARIAGTALGLLFVLVVAWSRVYLGVHHPGDVLGSMALTVAAELVWLPVLSWLTGPVPGRG